MGFIFLYIYIYISPVLEINELSFVKSVYSANFYVFSLLYYLFFNEIQVLIRLSLCFPFFLFFIVRKLLS